MAHPQSKGFGIIETLIASGILSLVAAGAVALNVQVLRNTALLADRLVAFEWVQEGIEVVRQIRDSNLIDGRPETDWKCFDPDATPSSANQFDCGFNDPALTSSRVYRLDLTTGQGRFALKQGTETNQFSSATLFTREIRIAPTTPADPEKRLVRVTVKFRFGSRTEQVTLSTIVSNWRRET